MLDVTLTSPVHVLLLMLRRRGEGATPQPGDVVVIHWAGYTKVSESDG
jgi:hypothetical protein